MADTFYAEPGFAIIYNADSAGISPESDPYTYRSLVHWCSEFLYPKRIGAARTGSVPIASNTYDAGRVRVTVHQLFAHGQAAAPLVEGKMTWTGGVTYTDVPLCGSVPAAGHWFTLGATATHVTLTEMVSTTSPAGTVSYEVSIFDLNMTATPDLEWTPTLFQVGSFSSDYRYIRKAASGGYALVSGRTCRGGKSGAGPNEGVTYHYKVGSHEQSEFNTFAGQTDPGTPTPTVEMVTV